MALDATKQARFDEINAVFRDRKKWLSGPERDGLRRELAGLLDAADAAPAGAGAASTDPQDAVRAADLVKALRGKLSATDRAAIGAELAEILARDPHAADAAPAADTAAGTPPAEAIVLAPSLSLTPRAIELTDQLRGNARHGSTERRQTLDALETELLAADRAGDGAGAA